MESPTAPAAPAPPSLPSPAPAAPPAPSTISATWDAASKGDFRAFDDAHVAERKGTPLARVEAPAAAAPPPAKEAVAPVEEVAAPPASTVSNRQQKTNDAIRDAVDRATADLRAELAQLRGQPSASVQPTVPAEKPATVPEYRRIAALPGAPKLDEFNGPDALGEHAAAMALFVHQTLEAEAQARTHGEQRQRFLQQREQQFGEKLQAAHVADPELASKLPPAVIHATPLSGCQPDAHGRPMDPRTGQPATFANVVAEAAFRSDDPPALLKYLHARQDETVAIAQLPSSEWLTALARLDGRLAGASSSAAPATEPAAPAAETPSTISAAPPPPPTLSRAGSPTDPQAAAFARGDFAAWDRIEQAKTLASRGAA